MTLPFKASPRLVSQPPAHPTAETDTGGHPRASVRPDGSPGRAQGGCQLPSPAGPGHREGTQVRTARRSWAAHASHQPPPSQALPREVLATVAAAGKSVPTQCRPGGWVRQPVVPCPCHTGRPTRGWRSLLERGQCRATPRGCGQRAGGPLMGCGSPSPSTGLLCSAGGRRSPMGRGLRLAAPSAPKPCCCPNPPMAKQRQGVLRGHTAGRRQTQSHLTEGTCPPQSPSHPRCHVATHTPTPPGCSLGTLWLWGPQAPPP